MKIRHSEAIWKGNLRSGNGYFSIGETSTRLPFSFNSRFEEGEGSNPEVLLGSALAGCYSMALSHELSESGARVTDIQTRAEVKLDKTREGFEIPSIMLKTIADVEGIDEEQFQETAEKVSRQCPVAKALKAIEITVDATMKSQ